MHDHQSDSSSSDPLPLPPLRRLASPCRIPRGPPPPEANVVLVKLNAGGCAFGIGAFGAGIAPGRGARGGDARIERRQTEKKRIVVSWMIQISDQ